MVITILVSEKVKRPAAFAKRVYIWGVVKPPPPFFAKRLRVPGRSAQNWSEGPGTVPGHGPGTVPRHGPGTVPKHGPQFDQNEP